MNPAPAPVAFAASPPPPSPRLASLDVYRGFVMFLMMAEVLRLSRVARALPESGFWKWVAWHQSHVEWVGCSLHDLIQPSFSFLVGVALPFSIASRRARGQSAWALSGHAFTRAVALVLLGVFLRSTGASATGTNWTFEDTLSQIGLGYGFLFLLGFRPLRDQVIALVAILVGYWALFAAQPLPSAPFEYAQVGVPKAWLESHGLSGFAAHWQKNSQPAWSFDTWFLNLFSREKPFVFNRGGYATLSFIPTLGTMIIGLIVGHRLRSARPPLAKIQELLIAGVAALAIGWALSLLGVAPVVKRIWTSSWVLVSGGWCCLFLAVFYFLVDVRGLSRWAWPLKVIGMNSIAAYLIAHLFEGFIAKALTTHLGTSAFRSFGSAYEPLLHGAATLAVMWLLLVWMDRRKLFLRI